MINLFQRVTCAKKHSRKSHCISTPVLLNPPPSRVFHHWYCLRDIQVVVEGYHDKLMSLTEKIVEKIVNFQMKEERFAFVKVSFRQSFPSFALLKRRAHEPWFILNCNSNLNWKSSNSQMSQPLIFYFPIIYYAKKLFCKAFYMYIDYMKWNSQNIHHSPEEWLSISFWG